MRLLPLAAVAWGQQEPEGFFESFHQHLKRENSRLPEYVCTQTIDRFTRSAPEEQWRKVDTLRFEVALIGGQERYGRVGANQFYDQPLADVVRSGVVSTGKFGLLVRQVFDTQAARYLYKGLNDRDGGKAHEYDFEVAAKDSNYQLRSGSKEVAVAFQGTFWIHPDTKDLLRVEMQAFDIPEVLGFSEAATTLVYGRVSLAESPLLLPVSVETLVVTADGIENRSFSKVNGCRRYQTQSSIRFEGEAATPEPRPVTAIQEHLQPGMVLDVALQEQLALNSLTVGQPVVARLARDLKQGDRVVAPQGSLVSGEVVHLEKESSPFATYEVGLELQTLEIHGQTLPIAATMEDAGPSAGLMRQSKRMEPSFSKRRGARMDILVRKVQRGQGYLVWDGRRGTIPKGFRMKWKIVAPEQ